MARSEDPKKFEDRKKDHIKISVDEGSQIGLSPSDTVELIHDPLTDVNFNEITIDTTSRLLNSSKPLMVSSMTGGHENSYEINKCFLNACHKMNWAFSTGSLRKELELIDQDQGDDEWSKLSQEFEGKVDLIGNIGVAQVITSPVSSFEKLISRYNLKGLFVHLNPLQEALQPEGTTDFKGSFTSIKKLKESLSVPVFIKETGTGFSKPSLEKASKLLIDAVDVSGFGGTHWGRVEGMRAGEGSKFDKASQVFGHFGVTTVESLRFAREVFKNEVTEVWASGGLRSGLDAAVCFALGAKVCGFASPVMKAALNGEEAVVQFMKQVEYELKIALFCTGSETISDLNYDKIMP